MVNFRSKHKYFIIKNALEMTIRDLEYYTSEFDAQIEKMGYNQYIIMIPVM